MPSTGMGGRGDGRCRRRSAAKSAFHPGHKGMGSAVRRTVHGRVASVEGWVRGQTVPGGDVRSPIRSDMARESAANGAGHRERTASTSSRSQPKPMCRSQPRVSVTQGYQPWGDLGLSMEPDLTKEWQQFSQCFVGLESESHGRLMIQNRAGEEPAAFCGFFTQEGGHCGADERREP